MPKGNNDSCDAAPVLNNLTYATLHNHPRSASFSPEDIAIFSHYPTVNHQIVIGHDGTIYKLSKTGSFKSNITPNTIQEAWKYHKQNLQETFQKKVNDGMSTNQAWKEHSHLTVKKLAKELGLKYERVNPKKK